MVEREGGEKLYNCIQQRNILISKKTYVVPQTTNWFSQVTMSL